MRLIVFAFLAPALLPAQSAFLKDPDIVWAVEIEQDWAVDIPSLDAEWDYGITTVKLLRTDRNVPDWMSPFLSGLVFSAAEKRLLPIFQDPLLGIPADPDGLFIRTDTVVTFDPDTYEEKVQIVHNRIDPVPAFKAWRLRQILAYHRKKATWSATVEAIAPLVQEWNGKGDSISLRPFFWFRPETGRKDVRSSDIVWAKNVRSRHTGTFVKLQDVRPVKVTEGFANPLPHLLDVLRTDMKTPFFSTLEGHKPLTPAERASMLSHSDTVVTFDPETYEEKMTIVHNDINPDDIKILELYMTWYWDERRSRLSIALDAVAPARDVYDPAGNFRFSIPMFIRKTRR